MRVTGKEERKKEKKKKKEKERQRDMVVHMHRKRPMMIERGKGHRESGSYRIIGSAENKGLDFRLTRRLMPADLCRRKMN